MYHAGGPGCAETTWRRAENYSTSGRTRAVVPGHVLSKVWLMLYSSYYVDNTSVVFDNTANGALPGIRSVIHALKRLRVTCPRRNALCDSLCYHAARGIGGHGKRRRSTLHIEIK